MLRHQRLKFKLAFIIYHTDLHTLEVFICTFLAEVHPRVTRGPRILSPPEPLSH